MTKLDIYMGSFTGTILLSELKFVDNIKHYSRYKCPCQGKDHFALNAGNYSTGKSITASPILHCYENSQKWWIIRDIENIILNEENRYFNLLNKFGDLGMVSAEEGYRLWNEQGVPLDFLEVNEPDELTILVKKHKGIK